MANPKGTKPLDEKWVSRKDMAFYLGISMVQLDNYRKLPHNPLPCDATGTQKKYPVSACIRWFIEMQIDKATAVGGGGSKSEAEKRLKFAQAELAELEVARQKEVTVTVDEAASRVEKVCTDFVASLGGIPGKHATDFVALPDEVHAQVALKKVTDRVRSELSDLYGLQDDD